MSDRTRESARSGEAAGGPETPSAASAAAERAASFAERSEMLFVETVSNHGRNAKNPGTRKEWQLYGKRYFRPDYLAALERGVNHSRRRRRPTPSTSSSTSTR